MIASLLLLSISCACSLAMQQPLNCSMLETQVRHSTGGNKPLQPRGDRFDDFDWDLSKELSAEEQGNIVISPISLKVVLAMLYEGAEGRTAQEIGMALDLVNSTALRINTRERFSAILKSLQTSKGEYEIKMGTHVFIDKNAVPKQMYKCILQQYYNSAMEEVDFSDTAAAVSIINNWARNVTEGHIQHLISEAEAHSNTIMLLLNAVYFKGLWQIPFPENQTQQGLFYLNNAQSVSVPLMNTTDRFLYYNITSLDARLIRLPYLGDKFSMYVVLPNSKTGLDTLVRTLGPDRPLINYLRNMTVTNVNLIMPKFEFDFTISLRPSLEKLGIKSMFSPSAELSKIAETKGGGLVVSNVLQKAGISVTEIGTTAYAATVVELMDKFGGDEEVVEFKVDRPFLFFIHDETVKTTVFVGKVTNPDKARVVSSTEAPATPSTTTCDSTTQAGSAGSMCSSPSNLDNRLGGDNEASQEKFNYFDADLLKEVAYRHTGSFVISPASVKTLLTLILEAAEGSTRVELQNLLRLPRNASESHQLLTNLHNSIKQSKNSQVRVTSVSKVFVSKELSPNETYKNTLKNYGAEVDNLDFASSDAAAYQINSWVRNKTMGLILDLIDPEMITPDTSSVLTSAIYFEGRWKNEFQRKQTKDLCFYSEPNFDCQRIPMMAKNEELYYKFDQALDAHVIHIPYEDERFSMVIVVPHDKDGIRKLTMDTARMSFPGLLKKLSLYEVNLTMPKFTIEYGTELTSILKEMHLNEVFTDSAQLPYMIKKGMGKVSAMVHKAKIEVTEKGTKAAAASGASVVPLMFGLDFITLQVDHPFYYFISERDSQSVLFAGRFSPTGRSPSAGVQTLQALPPPGNSGIPHATHNYQYDHTAAPSVGSNDHIVVFRDENKNSNRKNHNKHRHDCDRDC